MARDLEQRSVRHERAEVRLRLLRCPIRRIPEIERRRRLAGNDVVRDPRFEPRDGEHLGEGETTHEHVAPGEGEEWLEALDRPRDGVVR